MIHITSTQCKMEAGSIENFQKQIENRIQSILMPDGNNTKIET